MGKISANRVADFMLWLAEFKKNSKEQQTKRDERKANHEDRKQDVKNVKP